MQSSPQRAYTMPGPSSERLTETSVRVVPARKPKCSPVCCIPSQTCIAAPSRPILNMPNIGSTSLRGVLQYEPLQVDPEGSYHKDPSPGVEVEGLDGDKKCRPRSQCSSDDDECRPKRPRLSQKQPQWRGRSPNRPGVIRPMRGERVPSATRTDGVEEKSRSVSFIESTANTSECEWW